MENQPDVLWFRSQDVVSAEEARKIVVDGAAQRAIWAGPPYVLATQESGGRHLIGHQRLFLREYEVPTGSIRTVDAADDRVMACASLRQMLQWLSGWSDRTGVRWELQLGARRAALPGDPAEIVRDVCGEKSATDIAAIDRRYPDRPR